MQRILFKAAFVKIGIHLYVSYSWRLTESERESYGFSHSKRHQIPNLAFCIFSEFLISDFEQEAFCFAFRLEDWFVCTSVGFLKSSFAWSFHRNLNLVQGQFLCSDLLIYLLNQPWHCIPALTGHLRKAELSCTNSGQDHKILQFQNRYNLHNSLSGPLFCGHVGYCALGKIFPIQAQTML